MTSIGARANDADPWLLLTSSGLGVGGCLSVYVCAELRGYVDNGRQQLAPSVTSVTLRDPENGVRTHRESGSTVFQPERA